MFFTRDANEIVSHVLKSTKNQVDLESSKKVKEEVIQLLTELLLT